MQKRQRRSNYLSVQTSLVVPVILFSWFAWRGFNGMAEDQVFGWRWYAGLIGGISSLVMVAAASYGIYLNFKKNFKLDSDQ